MLDSKGRISHDDAVKKAGSICEAFRKKQDAAYISELDRKYPNTSKASEVKTLDPNLRHRRLRPHLRGR